MLTTTSQLLTMLQEEAGDSQPSSSTSTRLLNLLDRAHNVIIAGGGELNVDKNNVAIARPYLFPWAVSKNPEIFTLEAKQTGAAGVTNASTSVTIDIDSASKDLTDFEVRMGTDKVTYRIAAHSGTTVTLDSAYLGTTDASTTFTAFKLTYDIGTDIIFPSDFLRLYSEKGDSEISLVGLTEFLDIASKSDTQEGTPTVAGLVQQSGGTITLRFNSYPAEAIRVEMYKVADPATLDTVSVNPIIPARHRTILVHLAAFYHLRKRDDTRANSHLGTAIQIFQTLKAEADQVVGRYDRNFGRMSPWPNGWPGSRSRKVRFS